MTELEINNDIDVSTATSDSSVIVILDSETEVIQTMEQGPPGPPGQGLPGADGPPGAPGASGTSVLYGFTDPTTSIGNNGDFYINTTTHFMFGPKINTWPLGTSLIGPQGAQGAQGPQGAQGAQGAQGTPGTGAPGTIAPKVDGAVAVGVSPAWSHEDHVHPTDTSRLARSNDFLVTAASTGAIATSAGPSGTVMVMGGSTSVDAAFMTFHRPGFYASNFGIDSDNNWKVGGWSAAGVSYKLWHEGNFHPTNYVAKSGDEMSGSLSVAGSISAAGSSAAFNVFDRDGVTVNNWTVYAQSGYMQFYNGGNNYYTFNQKGEFGLFGSLLLKGPPEATHHIDNLWPGMRLAQGESGPCAPANTFSQGVTIQITEVAFIGGCAWFILSGGNPPIMIAGTPNFVASNAPPVGKCGVAWSTVLNQYVLVNNVAGSCLYRTIVYRAG